MGQDHSANDPGLNGFIGELMCVQFDLYAYIVVLLGGTDDAYDVLQETNQQILRLNGRHDRVIHFLAWAKRMAYFQVRTWRTKQSRERLVFDDVLFEQFAASVQQSSSSANARVQALNACMKKLPERMRELFLERYVDGMPVRKLAARLNRSSDGISVTLHRVRTLLQSCIQKRLNEERANG